MFLARVPSTQASAWVGGNGLSGRRLLESALQGENGRRRPKADRHDRRFYLRPEWPFLSAQAEGLGTEKGHDMPQSLAKVYLHAIFSTKNREPVLADAWRDELFCVL